MSIWSRTLAIAVVLFAGVALPVTPSRANSDIGIVVLHGTTGGSGDKSTEPFLDVMASAGYATQAPTLCWSRARMYDAPYPACLQDIDTAVAALRKTGARRIVVAGQSQGGNAALVYASQHPELAGVIALAPAGQPAQTNRNPQVANSVADAQRMVAAGQGAERSRFTFINMGIPFSVQTTAAIYLSFTQKGGPADFPAVLPRLHMPVLWVASTIDRTQERAPALFATIPENPLNKLVRTSTSHLDTPASGAAAAVAWLKSLPAQ